MGYSGGMSSPRARLSDIVEAIQFANDESAAFWDRRTAQVAVISAEERAAAEDESLAADAPDWQQGQITIARLIDEDADGRFVPLPTRFDVHEWRMMASFAESLEDEAAGHQLRRVLGGSGAFRRFKDRLRALGVEDQWYAYRDERYLALATAWCEEHGIEWAVEDGAATDG
jgi:hypothetical protein